MSGLGDPLPVAAGAIPDLAVAPGAIPDVPVAGVTLPDGVGAGSLDAGFPDEPGGVEPGGVDWPPSPDGGGLDGPPGDLEPTLGLGETIGVRLGARVLVGCADGAAEDGTTSGAGGGVDTFSAPLELAAAGDAVGGVGPLMHGGGELVVDDVVWALAGLPEFTPLLTGPGVVAELDADGAGVVGVAVGLGVVGLAAGLCVLGVPAGVCAGLTAGAGARLVLGGISAEAQEMVGDGVALALALALALARALALAEAPPPPWPFPDCGCPLPDVVPPPPWPDPDDGPEDEPMFAIACRRPGTAAAVPPNSTMAATTSAGRSQTVPSWCRAVRVLASVVTQARRPFAAATAANAARAGAISAHSFFTPSETG